MLQYINVHYLLGYNMTHGGGVTNTTAKQSVTPIHGRVKTKLDVCALQGYTDARTVRKSNIAKESMYD